MFSELSFCKVDILFRSKGSHARVVICLYLELAKALVCGTSSHNMTCFFSQGSEEGLAMVHMIVEPAEKWFFLDTV